MAKESVAEEKSGVVRYMGDPDKKKPETLWSHLKSALFEAQLHEYAEKIYGDAAPEQLHKFYVNRIMRVILCLFSGAILAWALSPWAGLVGVGIAALSWRSDYKRFQKNYQNFQFLRQFAFNKFRRTSVPYLYDGSSVYSMLERMRFRTPEGQVRHELEVLMGKMRVHVDQEPLFRDFAVRASGEDDAQTFMETLFDYMQNSNDTSILQDLAKMANDDLFSGIREVYRYKLGLFSFFPTKITMASFIIIVGYTASMIMMASHTFS